MGGLERAGVVGVGLDLHGDMADAEPVLQVCGRVLAEVRPAATIVIVSGLLTAEMRVEIAVTARVG